MLQGSILYTITAPPASGGSNYRLWSPLPPAHAEQMSGGRQSSRQQQQRNTPSKHRTFFFVVGTESFEVGGKSLMGSFFFFSSCENVDRSHGQTATRAQQSNSSWFGWLVCQDVDRSWRWLRFDSGGRKRCRTFLTFIFPSSNFSRFAVLFCFFISLRQFGLYQITVYARGAVIKIGKRQIDEIKMEGTRKRNKKGGGQCERLTQRFDKQIGVANDSASY